MDLNPNDRRMAIEPFACPNCEHHLLVNNMRVETDPYGVTHVYIGDILDATLVEGPHWAKEFVSTSAVDKAIKGLLDIQFDLGTTTTDDD